MPGQHGRHLIGAHHTGIAAENINMEIRHALFQIFKCLINLHNGQAVIPGSLVKADAAFRTGTMVPQHRDRPVCRILFQAEAQELLQAVRVAHGAAAPVLQFFKISVPDHSQRPGIGLQVIQKPFLRAAGQHHHIDGIPGFHFRHLHQVLAGIFLQVCSAHVNQQGGGFGAGSCYGKKQRQQHSKANTRFLHIYMPPFCPPVIVCRQYFPHKKTGTSGKNPGRVLYCVPCAAQVKEETAHAHCTCR